MVLGLIVFGILALGVIASAVGMLMSHNAVHSVLFLVANFIVVALLYFMLGAPFIALAQITVYGGAIMVLFLFVIMLLGAEQLPGIETLKMQRPLVILLALVALVEALAMLLWRNGSFGQALPAPLPDAGSPEIIGMALFNQYTLPFEITSIILLIGVVGAISLTVREKKTYKKVKE